MVVGEAGLVWGEVAMEAVDDEGDERAGQVAGPGEDDGEQEGETGGGGLEESGVGVDGVEGEGGD